MMEWLKSERQRRWDWLASHPEIDCIKCTLSEFLLFAATCVGFGMIFMLLGKVC